MPKKSKGLTFSLECCIFRVMKCYKSDIKMISITLFNMDVRMETIEMLSALEGSSNKVGRMPASGLRRALQSFLDSVSEERLMDEV